MLLLNQHNCIHTRRYSFQKKRKEKNNWEGTKWNANERYQAYNCEWNEHSAENQMWMHEKMSKQYLMFVCLLPITISLDRYGDALFICIEKWSVTAIVCRSLYTTAFFYFGPYVVFCAIRSRRRDKKNPRYRKSRTLCAYWAASAATTVLCCFIFSTIRTFCNALPYEQLIQRIYS